MSETASMGVVQLQPEEAPNPSPHSIEAEQQLLGAILNDNEAYDSVASIVSAQHFYDPLHARIFEFAENRIRKNALVSVITLTTFLEGDKALNEVGGTTYIARLAAASISSFAVRDYAQLIYDCAIRRELISLGIDISDNAARSDHDREPREQIVDAEQRLYELAEQGKTESDFKSLLRASTLALEMATAAYKRGGQFAGLSTGFIDLDRKLGGLHRSDLLILAGRPSMGKTALATNIAFNVAKAYKRGTLSDGNEGAVEGGVVGFFSLEMSAEQLATRIISGISEVPSEQIRRGDLQDEEFEKFCYASKTVETCPLYIDDTPALSIAQLAARARRLKRRHGLDLLVVDYLQLVRAGQTRDNRVIEINDVTQGLKALAKECDIPVLALSQLSRQVEAREDKRPQLNDLRESGSIEQDADVVMFVFREEYYAERSKPPADDTNKMDEWYQKMIALHNKAEVIIGKQRHGPLANISLTFLGEYTRFSNWADENSHNAN